MTTTDMPNPGTPEAVALGCHCPIYDNRHGVEVPGHEGWWIVLGCPVHAPTETAVVDDSEVAE